MQEVFEKIIEKLGIRAEKSEKKEMDAEHFEYAQMYKGERIAFGDAIEIVKQAAAEYNNGWIPVSERLPNEAYGCLVTVMDCEPSTQTEFENILPYFVGYDGETWNDADGEEIPFEVIAWQPLPAPPQNEYKQKKTNFDRCCESVETMAQIIDIAKIGWTKEQIMEWLQKEECEVPE